MAPHKTIFHNGAWKTIPKLAKELGISASGLRYRVHSNLPLTPYKPINISLKTKIELLNQWVAKVETKAQVYNYCLIYEWIKEKAAKSKNQKCIK